MPMGKQNNSSDLSTVPSQNCSVRHPTDIRLERKVRGYMVAHPPRPGGGRQPWAQLKVRALAAQQGKGASVNFKESGHS
jgi:hypothetical protein